MAIEIQITNATLDKIRMRDRETLRSIYKETYPMVENYILKNKGAIADSEDIFQDAMYLFIKKTEISGFELTAKPSTFIFGIAKNLWLKELVKKRIDVHDLLRENEANEIVDQVELTKLNQVQKMKNCIIRLGEPCKTIIEQFYFFKTSMKEIAEMLHYTNANNAKNQKYKCFIRLKKMILTATKN